MEHYSAYFEARKAHYPEIFTEEEGSKKTTCSLCGVSGWPGWENRHADKAHYQCEKCGGWFVGINSHVGHCRG